MTYGVALSNEWKTKMTVKLKIHTVAQQRIKKQKLKYIGLYGIINWTSLVV